MTKKIAFLVISIILASGLTTISNASILTFDSAPVLSNTQAPGTWYVDRYAPAEFDQAYFDGGNRLHIEISGADQQSSSFYNYQGRKYDFNSPVSGYSINGSLYVDSNWETENTNVGMWGTIFDSSQSVSAYPIIAFRNDGTDPVGFYGFDYLNTGNWFLVDAVSSYNEWYNLSMVYSSGNLNYYIDGALVYQFADTNIADYQTIGNIILDSYNFGSTYDVYWDNVGTSPVPEPSTMLLLGFGLIGLAAITRKRMRA